MKYWTKLKLAAVLPAVLLSFGCADFLTLEPEQAVSNDAFFQSMGDFRAAMIGIHDQMQDADWYGRSVPLVSDLMSEDIKLNGSANRYSEFADFSGLAISGHQYEISAWAEMYEAINMANMMINADFEPRPAVEAEYRQLIGEAHAARALAQFDLVKLYGQHYTFTGDASHPGVPIVLEHAIDSRPARNTVGEVYTQVVTDFQTALDMMTSARSGPFMFSPNAVRALLSRVYLYMEECEQAVAMADAVINSGEYSLAEGSSYVTQFADGGSSEAILEIAYSPADNIGSNSLGGMYRASGYGDYLPSRDLLDLIDPNDLRMQMYVEDPDLKGAYASHRVNKYPTVTNTDNVSVIRLSEVYLNRAEALQCLGRDQEAQDDLNLIRQRANPSAPEVAATGQALLDEILIERRIELANEGHAVHDVMRHQRDIVRDDFTGAASVMTYPCQFCILPIPFDELDVNPNITQNPGYGS
jgi:tetratricopeptide (TPR) repeat protein